jgi:hypothetical protein
VDALFHNAKLAFVECLVKDILLLRDGAAITEKSRQTQQLRSRFIAAGWQHQVSSARIRLPLSRCLYAFGLMNDDEQLQSARKAIREALAFAHSNLYRTNGQAWRQIIASLAFETKAELSLIQYFDEQDQARFNEITQAFMAGVLPVGDMVDLYLEWFPRPREWKDFDEG